MQKPKAGSPGPAMLQKVLDTSFGRKPASDNDIRSSMSLEDWEDAVFANVDYFRLHRYHGRGGQDRSEVKTWPEALELAQAELKANRRVLIYAVSKNGRFINCTRSRWDHYSKLWEKQHASTT